MSKIIYFASPYSHNNKDIVEYRIRMNSEKVALMVSEGNVVISPIIYGHHLLKFHNMPSDWKFWKNFCCTFLDKCDEMVVYMLDGWNISEGLLEEIEMAKNMGIKITYIS